MTVRPRLADVLVEMEKMSGRRHHGDGEDAELHTGCPPTSAQKQRRCRAVGRLPTTPKYAGLYTVAGLQLYAILDLCTLYLHAGLYTVAGLQLYAILDLCTLYLHAGLVHPGAELRTWHVRLCWLLASGHRSWASATVTRHRGMPMISHRL